VKSINPCSPVEIWPSERLISSGVVAVAKLACLPMKGLLEPLLDGRFGCPPVRSELRESLAVGVNLLTFQWAVATVVQTSCPHQARELKRVYFFGGGGGGEVGLASLAALIVSSFGGGVPFRLSITGSDIRGGGPLCPFWPRFMVSSFLRWWWWRRSRSSLPRWRRWCWRIMAESFAGTERIDWRRRMSGLLSSHVSSPLFRFGWWRRG